MPDQGLYVLSVFQRLKGKMTRLIEPVVQAEGLTPLQGYVLMLLSQGELTVGALSELTNMGQGNTSSLCKRLERSGHLVRSRNPRDERTVTLSLTQQGQDTLGRIQRRFARYGQALEGLPEAVKEDLRRGVQAADVMMDYLQHQFEGEQPQC